MLFRDTLIDQPRYGDCIARDALYFSSFSTCSSRLGARQITVFLKKSTIPSCNHGHLSSLEHFTLSFQIRTYFQRPSRSVVAFSKFFENACDKKRTFLIFMVQVFTVIFVLQGAIRVGCISKLFFAFPVVSWGERVGRGEGFYYLHQTVFGTLQIL